MDWNELITRFNQRSDLMSVRHVMFQFHMVHASNQLQEQVGFDVRCDVQSWVRFKIFPHVLRPVELLAWFNKIELN